MDFVVVILWFFFFIMYSWCWCCYISSVRIFIISFDRVFEFFGKCEIESYVDDGSDCEISGYDESDSIEEIFEGLVVVVVGEDIVEVCGY